MSRIGKQVVKIPANVTVKAEGQSVSVKGPKGELKLATRPEVKVSVEGGKLVVDRLADERDNDARAFHGMTRALLQNMITGVSTGYERKLEINGVGYTAKMEGAKLVLSIGFSHPVKVSVPASVTVACPSQTQILITGCDKQQVGMVAARIRKLRPPEPYKGKGIKYEGEFVRRKVGKRA